MTDDNPFLQVGKDQGKGGVRIKATSPAPRISYSTGNRRQKASMHTRICPYCSVVYPKDLLNNEFHRHRRTKDHVWPTSRFPSFCNKMVVYACQTCNGDKADMTIFEWLVKLRQKDDFRAHHVRLFIDREDPNQHLPRGRL